MEVSGHGDNLWDHVLDLTKTFQQNSTDPLLWAIQVSSCLNSAGVSLPSPELASLLVSFICWDNNVPISWKFLEKALEMKIVPPMLAIAHLFTRVVLYRHSQPVAYRLYMELLKRHAFTLKSQMNTPSCQKIFKSIDLYYEVNRVPLFFLPFFHSFLSQCRTFKSIDILLHFSLTYQLQVSDPGVIVVEFIFSIVWQLLDASLDDEGLLELTPENNFTWATKPQDMEIDDYDSYVERKTEDHEIMRKMNTVMAVEMIAQFLKNKVTSKILCLARRNMPTHWMTFTNRLKLLISNSSALRSSAVLSPEDFVELMSDSHLKLSQQLKKSSLQKCHGLLAVTSCASSNLCHGITRSALWLPLDLVLENAMDASLVTPTSAVEIIIAMTKALQAINGMSWHDTFLGLWLASLRLVQRGRAPIEGPVPRLDTRLCILLSITVLVVAELIEEEETVAFDETKEHGMSNQWHKEVPREQRVNLVSSLQALGDYQGLLTPPQSFISAANQAAAKATMFLSQINVGNGYFECVGMDMPIQCSGNMRHLIVEACLARNLLDTSAYFWPGYVNGHINQDPRSVPSQASGWSSFMKGSPLTPQTTSILASTPASRAGETV